MTPEYLEELADIADPDKLWRAPGLEQLALKYKRLLDARRSAMPQEGQPDRRQSHETGGTK